MNLKNAELKSRKDAATPRGVGVMCDFYAERAQNAELWDVEGRRFIDFAAGIAVCNTGHRHPKIVAAIRDQLDRFTHTAYQIVPYASYVELAEKLNERAPGDHPKKTAFFTTGAEAVENAIKIARAATGRPGVIAFTGGFHGRTLMGMALTGKVAPYKAGFGPFPSDVFHAPFPNPLHGVSTADSLKAIEFLFKADIDPKRVAAIIFEPVQGEGGFYPAPAEFVRALRKLCNEHGILLIADEVQTGFARTGKLFAMHHYDVVPDLMTVAKSLAGGMPLSGVHRPRRRHGCGGARRARRHLCGNPLAVAAALAVLDIIDEEKLCERATILGDRVKAKLIALQNEAPQIADVRGPGGMVAVEFCKPGSTEPDAEFTKRVQTRALERGLLLLVCGVYSNVVRFLFPLTIEDTVFDEALAILEDVIKDSVAVAA
ncbi:4-aminobutyrate--2-oxoglutarate transaminase [Paraburkholderia strydomiana]|nr:4-aminobutyrate--2-oxoglutarate transaminase [Paraburkholderia strydomiana]